MTLFAWQKPYEIQWAEEDNVLYVRSGRGKKQFWIPPFARKDGSFVKGVLRMHEWFEEHGYPFLMKGVTPAEDIFDECLEAEKTWYNQHEDGDDDDELLGERHAIETVFNNWSVLQPTGGAIRMYNKIVAFSIGEMLNDDTAIIHFEKSDPTIRGLYQAINHEFVVHAWGHTTYINREEDMGIPGLRHSKESYNPDHFVEKYDVTLRKK